MTLEYAIDRLSEAHYFSDEYNGDKLKLLIEDIYSYFEQQLKEANAYKTCDGCIYYSVDDWNDFVCKQMPCSRYCDDYYKQRCNK